MYRGKKKVAMISGQILQYLWVLWSNSHIYPGEFDFLVVLLYFNDSVSPEILGKIWYTGAKYIIHVCFKHLFVWCVGREKKF